MPESKATFLVLDSNVESVKLAVKRETQNFPTDSCLKEKESDKVVVGNVELFITCNGAVAGIVVDLNKTANGSGSLNF